MHWVRYTTLWRVKQLRATGQATVGLPKLESRWLLIPSLGAAIAIAVGAVLWVHNPLVVRENGFVENAQAMLVGLAVYCHARLAYRENRSSAKLSRIALALLCATVTLREIDVDKLGSASAWVATEIALRAVLLGAWLAVFWRIVRTQRNLFSWQIARSHVCLLTAIAIALYLGGWAVEKLALLDPANARLGEELLQLGGAVFFLSASSRSVSDLEERIPRR